MVYDVLELRLRLVQRSGLGRAFAVSQSWTHHPQILRAAATVARVHVNSRGKLCRVQLLYG